MSKINFGGHLEYLRNYPFYTENNRINEFLYSQNIGKDTLFVIMCHNETYITKDLSTNHFDNHFGSHLEYLKNHPF